VSTYRDYAQAAELLWGPAGEFAAAEFGRLNREHFAGSIPPLPIIISLTAYGRCIGFTRGGTGWLTSPRITLAPELFTGNHRLHGGPKDVSDTLIHEMAHAALILRHEDPDHNAGPWCKIITELSPALTGQEINAQPVRPRRIPNPHRETDDSAPKTIVVRKAEPGTMTQAELARWPHSIRPPGWHDGDTPIPVPTY
jgi:hypothetical protein